MIVLPISFASRIESICFWNLQFHSIEQGTGKFCDLHGWVQPHKVYVAAELSWPRNFTNLVMFYFICKEWGLEVDCFLVLVMVCFWVGDVSNRWWLV